MSDPHDSHRTQNHQRTPRDLARTLVDRLARNSTDTQPGAGHPHDMRAVVDPQVPEDDRDLLHHADPDRLAHARTHSLPQLRQSRWHTPGLARMDDHSRDHAAQGVLLAALSAAWGTLSPPTFVLSCLLFTGEWMSPAPLIFNALIGWIPALIVTGILVSYSGLARRPRVDPTHAAAHRRPGRFLLPQDLGEDGCSLVAILDEMINNPAVHKQAPDQVPALREHLWRLAGDAAAHEHARGQGANAQALDESLSSLIKHANWLSTRTHQALSRPTVGEQQAAGADQELAAEEATRELRARQAGTQVFLDDLRGQARSEHGSDPWDSAEM